MSLQFEANNMAGTARRIGRRSLGRSGLELSELGLGCGTIAGLYEPTSTEEARAVIADALAAGITYIDTAPFYGAGRAERFAGDALREYPKTCVLSTKAGRLLRSRAATLAPLPKWRKFSLPREMWVQAFDFDTVADYTYDGIMRSFEDSQQRLGMPHIDLLLMHDVGLPFFFGEHRNEIIKEAMTGGYRALEELRRAGDIGGFGLGVGETDVCIQAFDHGDWDIFLIAGRYTLLDQAALDTLFPLCAKRGTRIIAGQPFNSGMLVGRASFDHTTPPQAIVERVRRLTEVCAAHKVPLAAAAIQFPLGHPVVASVLPGPRTRREVSAMLDLYSQDIPVDLWGDLLSEGLLPRGTPVPHTRSPDLIAPEAPRVP
jgi:D-threo-aldose 1-dehydrogenase